MDGAIGRISNRDENARQPSLVTWSFYLVVGGITLGLASPKNAHLPSRPWQILSNIVGYTYFLAWSASFYPQIFLNHRRRTTRGLSVDFCVLNVLGYVCYTVYTANFYWNESVIETYRDSMSGNGKGEITVQGNDVAFAIHAILMASITLSQIGIYIYDKYIYYEASLTESLHCPILRRHSLRMLHHYIFSTWFLHGHVDLLGFLYVLGTIKIMVIIGKYIPQALLN